MSENNTKVGSVGGTTACRQMAKPLLLDQIEKSERETKRLKALYSVIQWDSMTPEEEELVWGYFCFRSIN